MDQVAARTRRAPPKTYRFDARLNEEQKVLIQRAADLEGRTMTDFVIHSAEAAAEGTKAFADAILKPAEPGPVLRGAAREYRRKNHR